MSVRAGVEGGMENYTLLNTIVPINIVLESECNKNGILFLVLNNKKYIYISSILWGTPFLFYRQRRIRQLRPFLLLS